MSTNKITEALLVLSDGEVFEGEAIGYKPPSGIATGEVVFNTVMSGYQEVMTDPSYAGQIITFTYPHIGNYGINATDNESRGTFCRGVIVRELSRRTSNWRAESSLAEALEHWQLSGIAGIDTRRLTRHIRESGAMPGAFGTASLTELQAAAKAEPGTDGVDLVKVVTTDAPYTFGDGPMRVVAYDYGIKRNILRHLAKIATVTVVPGHMRADDVLAYEPHGIFLSNGPGDPVVCDYAVQEIKTLLNQVPIFGICLGHQLLSTALGGQTFKLPFGHHGGNHPVKHVATGRVEITSQNHNFAVAEGSLANADVTHLNLNDGVIEGIACRDLPAFSVQHHPEAGPGPHESTYLFDDFCALMTTVNKNGAAAAAKALNLNLNIGNIGHNLGSVA
jgi:carbamoyl-phosphate synthase small subunit